MTDENTNKERQFPVKTFRDRAIKVSIWENCYTNPETGKTRIYHSLDLQRGYKQGDVWKHTTSINSDDTLRVITLYQEAYRWVSLQKNSHAVEQPEPTEIL